MKQEHASSLSTDKLLVILECIAKETVPVRLQTLAELTNMTQPTVLRYLRTLQSSNYVYQDETTLRYALTWKLCALTENLNSYISLRNIASTFVNTLASELQLGVCIVINQNDKCLYLDCIDRPRASSPLQYIGKSAPLHTTGSGKLLLSAYSNSQLEHYISTHGLIAYTAHTIIDRDVLLQELQDVRSRGFAYDREECEIGLYCLSYPIYSYTGSIYAAISVFGPVEDMSDELTIKQIHSKLGNAAQMISSRLGYEAERTGLILT